MLNKDKKILVFGGGGVFGLIPVVLLRNTEVKDIREKVDILSGSSIGALVALSLAIGYQPNEIYDLFFKEANKIFYRPFLRRINPFKSKYCPDKYEKFLQKHFQNKKLKDLSIKVVIPSLSFKNTSPKIFTNFEGSPDLDTYLWQVVRASSAAPSFFPPYGDDVLLDGGIIENIPVIISTTEAKEHLHIDFGKMSVFAFGSGNRKVPGNKDKSHVKNYTVFGWLTRFLIPYVTKSNEITTNLVSKNLGLNQYILYNPIETKGSLDAIDQLLSGKIEEDCMPYIIDCKEKFSDFLK